MHDVALAAASADGVRDWTHGQDAIVTVIDVLGCFVTTSAGLAPWSSDETCRSPRWVGSIRSEPFQLVGVGAHGDTPGARCRLIGQA